MYPFRFIHAEWQCWKYKSLENFLWCNKNFTYFWKIEYFQSIETVDVIFKNIKVLRHLKSQGNFSIIEFRRNLFKKNRKTQHILSFKFELVVYWSIVKLIEADYTRTSRVPLTDAWLWETKGETLKKKKEKEKGSGPLSSSAPMPSSNNDKSRRGPPIIFLPAREFMCTSGMCVCECVYSSSIVRYFSGNKNISFF